MQLVHGEYSEIFCAVSVIIFEKNYNYEAVAIV